VFQAHFVRVSLIVSVFFMVACRQGPLEVDAIQMGRALNPDKSVANHTTSFKPGDTVYVAVLTKDSGSGVIGVRWTYGGRVVDEPKKDVSYKGAGVTEFHATGFHPGDYGVEIFIDGASVGKRAFRVEQ
jgi:hypothetical protein